MNNTQLNYDIKEILNTERYITDSPYQNIASLIAKKRV